MARTYNEHTTAADEHIREVNGLLASPAAGSLETAQIKATLAVAEAMLAVASVARSVERK